MWEKITSLSTKQRCIGGAFLAACFICIVLYVLFLTGSAKGEGDNISVEVTSGMTTAEIADTLAQKGVINSSAGFRILAKLGGYETDFKEGVYYFKSDMRVGVCTAKSRIRSAKCRSARHYSGRFYGGGYRRAHGKRGSCQ